MVSELSSSSKTPLLAVVGAAGTLGPDCGSFTVRAGPVARVTDGWQVVAGPDFFGPDPEGVDPIGPDPSWPDWIGPAAGPNGKRCQWINLK